MPSYRHQLAKILKVLFVVDGQLVLQILHPVVLDLGLEADAERVITRKVRGLTDQEQPILSGLQQVLRLVARYAAMEPPRK